jgi:hypothetical protein
VPHPAPTQPTDEPVVVLLAHQGFIGRAEGRERHDAKEGEYVVAEIITRPQGATPARAKIIEVLNATKRDLLNYVESLSVRTPGSPSAAAPRRREGRIVAHHSGAFDWSQPAIRDALEELLKDNKG